MTVSFLALSISALTSGVSGGWTSKRLFFGVERMVSAEEVSGSVVCGSSISVMGCGVGLPASRVSRKSLIGQFDLWTS